MNNLLPPPRKSEIKASVILIFLLTSVLGIFYIVGLNEDKKSTVVSPEPAFKQFPEVSLEARAAYVYDAREKRTLFAQNEDVRLPLASLTKVMTALVAKELGSPNGVVSITSAALEAPGDSGLYRGERWSLKDILDFSLVTSSNDAMRAVALTLGALSKSEASPEEIISDFVLSMNRRAEELGLQDTYFWNETGLDLKPRINGSEAKPGAYGTARDVNTLLEYILNHESGLLEATRDYTLVFYSLDNNVHVARNTNNITANIPGLLGSKTGFTDSAGGNLTIIFDPELGRPFIVTVMGSSVEGRFRDMETLVAAIMQYLTE